MIQQLNAVSPLDALAAPMGRCDAMSAALPYGRWSRVSSPPASSRGADDSGSAPKRRPPRTRLNTTDGTNLDATDDYSHGTNTSYIDWTKVTASINGALVLSTEP